MAVRVLHINQGVQMFLSKKTITDSLFGVQVICTLISGTAQSYRMITTAQGVSPSWFVTWEIFLIINLALAVRAHRNQPSRVTRQTIATYLLWVFVITLYLSVMILKGTGSWSVRDTATMLLIGVCVPATLVVARQRALGITDPIVRGWLALFFKAIPQLVLAYNILTVGGAGLAGLMIFVGHITILTRIGQLWFSIREAGWDRNRIGSAMSEIANEASWIVATIAWFIAS